MSNMYDKIGESKPESLLADVYDAYPIAVPMEPGNGEVAPGQVIYRKSTGFWAPAASANIANSNLLAVLDEAVDTGTEIGVGAVAQTAKAYQTGRFIDGKVLYDASGTLTKVTAAHKVVLALFGIYFGQSVESAEEFDNGSYTITYVPNNGVTPAEASVKEAKLPGNAYTVLNNSSSKLGFTAPATKSFSKWNTKADGSGTDYAAAASYTTDADLTLYAVWA